MQKKPTHAAVSQFVASILPSTTNDVQRLYHVPRHPKYDSNSARVDQVVLSVTPTPGVYDLIGFEARNEGTSGAPGLIHTRPPRTICFLHRPFRLERRRVRRGTLVLASHTSFDENLTVGWNIALAERLGVNVAQSSCVQGYKGDPERKIGIVGQTKLLRGLLLDRIKQEFGDIEFYQEGKSEDIHVVAIMNAFHAEEVHRVLAMAKECDHMPKHEQRGRHVLYLTGQPRESGLSAARESGMSVVCVGHRSAEEWGIQYIASRLRGAFPGVDVKEIFEEEELLKGNR